jgi:hypothetical protein
LGSSEYSSIEEAAQTGATREQLQDQHGERQRADDFAGLAYALRCGAADVPLDPFSPDLKVFLGQSTPPAEELRRQSLDILNSLEIADAERRDFYARRRTHFQNVSGERPSSAEGIALGEDLLYSFSEDSLASAARLGLAPVRTNSRRHLAYLLRHSWKPEFLKDVSIDQTKERLWGVNYPTGSSDRLINAIEFFLINPFISSCGMRYGPCLVVEDLLIEDFTEPEPKHEMPRTQLLSELGLESRWGLSRIDIEAALSRNGPRIVREALALDPEVFRLVAIPADIYTHIGPGLGWGEKEMWTHFDGYRLRDDGNLHALAGGDKRFGGSHDVVTFNPAYTNAKILARFAVVQRRRMLTWYGNNI